MSVPFDAAPVLSYLSLPADYRPSPLDTPIEFLVIHLRQLPPNLLALFSSLLAPNQRTVLPIIRNRRQRYASSIPHELTWSEARNRWPTLWEGREPPGREQANDEKEWANRGLAFLGGAKGQVGKLGQLLGDYEEEREAERMRQARREKLADIEVAQAEEEEDMDEEGDQGLVVEEPESPNQARIAFERIVKERFIYGLLDSIDYDSVDWDDRWDEIDERDSEERWFDEEEADVPVETDELVELASPVCLFTNEMLGQPDGAKQ